jgi:hypothetical protein
MARASYITPDAADIAQRSKKARKLRLFANVLLLEGCRTGPAALPRAYSIPINRNEVPVLVLTRFTADKSTQSA